METLATTSLALLLASAAGNISEGFDSPHESVLTKEILEHLNLKDGDVVLDATAGQGGHSEALLNAAEITLLALDADPRAVAHTKARLAQFNSRARVVEANFSNLKKTLATYGIEKLDSALFDLGWNRGQLSGGRGFSFQKAEPLSMSYGSEPLSGFSAADILNTWSEEAIANVLYGYGEERYARRIAKKIIETRLKEPFTTTAQLVTAVENSVPTLYKRGRLNPATKTFQALRIAVNDELGALERGVAEAFEVLSAGGRLAVISFHSIEDRRVKQLFASWVKEGKGILVTKKPVIAQQEEMLRNPSSRSAKLRIITKQ
jgi:16S rRNA (cytosine1402-N4)-methyltransferase